MAFFNQPALATIRSGQNHEQVLSGLYQQRQANFEKNYVPLLDELAGDTNSRSLVASAQRQAKLLPGQLSAMSARTQSRYAGGLTAAQRMQVSHSQNGLAALSAGSAVNTARAQQRSRNESLRSDLMQVSEDMINNGSANLTQFAANEQQRKQAAAAAKKSFTGQLLSLGGAVIGGIYGGPAGAAAGASLGSAVGGAIG